MIARILAALVASVFAAQSVAQGLPDLGDISSKAISEAQERTIGNRIMRDIRADPAFIDDPEVAAAHARMENGDHIGKIVLEVRSQA